MKPSEFFAVAAPGLEPIVLSELEQLGIRGTSEQGGVTWHGHAASLYTALVHLRTASRVLRRVAAFRARTFAELEQHARAIGWTEFLQPGDRVRLRVSAGRSRLYHENAIAERLHAAMTAAVHVRVAPAAADEEDESSDERLQTFVVRMLDDQCTISIDAGGRLLHMRGYRAQGGKAPLRETVAAAMLMAGQVAVDAPLLDPMCGSGTIAIEAALRARAIPPGLAAASREPRTFALQRWPSFDASRWSDVIERAREQILPSAPAPIVASDRDTGAVAIAQANAELAGVSSDIEFSRHALSGTVIPAGSGALVSNPPWGLRVGERAGLRDLYATVGNVAREQLSGWRILLLVADRRLATQMRLPLATVFATRIGATSVELVAADVP